MMFDSRTCKVQLMQWDSCWIFEKKKTNAELFCFICPGSKTETALVLSISLLLMV